MSFLSRIITSLQDNVWYALTIALLAITSIVMLGYELTPYSEPEFVALFQQLDMVIAYIFLTDFFAGLLFNTKYNWRTYWKYNWLNLISSIPVTSDTIRILRILRIIRAFRVIRAGMNLWFAHRRLRRVRKSQRS
jgi:voltage-gated potassium channel